MSQTSGSTGRAAPFRRRVALLRPGPGVVAAEVEDHIHHFAVDLEHNDGVVTMIAGRALRAPWSLCPGATAKLSELVGEPVGALARVEDAASHCTHLLDLATLAAHFAGTGAGSRRLFVTVRDWDTPHALASVVDDGHRLDWVLHGQRILTPPPFAGRSLGAGFSAWALDALEPEVLELALVLRRAAWMSPAKGIDLDRFERLAEAGVAMGSCFASQPGRIEAARRNRGSSLTELAAPGSRRRGST